MKVTSTLLFFFFSIITINAQTNYSQADSTGSNQFEFLKELSCSDTVIGQYTRRQFQQEFGEGRAIEKQFTSRHLGYKHLVYVYDSLGVEFRFSQSNVDSLDTLYSITISKSGICNQIGKFKYLDVGVTKLDVVKNMGEPLIEIVDYSNQDDKWRHTMNYPGLELTFSGLINNCDKLQSDRIEFIKISDSSIGISSYHRSICD